ncbi:putative type II secretion system protein [Campylobacter iguaniorum]|nr:putative type II secretion system protein [Campylobacter iguaniorum]
MSKKAFTMVELVFVIVILGILASIAVPKLVATKTDADIAKMVAQMKNFITTVSALEITNHKAIQEASTEGPFESYITLLQATIGNDNFFKEYQKYNNENQWTSCVMPYIEKDTSEEYILKFHESPTKNFCQDLCAHPTVKEWIKNGVKLGGDGIFKEN